MADRPSVETLVDGWVAVFLLWAPIPMSEAAERVRPARDHDGAQATVRAKHMNIGSTATLDATDLTLPGCMTPGREICSHNGQHC